MTKKQELQIEVQNLRKELDTVKARLLALNAPVAFYNDMYEHWMFFPEPKYKRIPIETMLYGKGYKLVGEKPL